MTADDIIAALPRGARVLVQGAAGESRALADAVERSPRTDLSFTGVWLPGVNRARYGVGRGGRVTAFFMTPELAASGASVEFLPLGYNDIRAYLQDTPFDACMAMLSTEDATGACSFGVAVDFIAELWPRIPIRIGHLNANMPRTSGHESVPRAALTHVLEAAEPLYAAPPDREDDVAQKIGAHFAALAPDGATLQAGVGALPGACMRALRQKKALRIYSGLIGDWALDLLEADALGPSPVTAGLALGSARLYDAVASPRFSFVPVGYTHAAARLGALERFVSVNGAMEVDLLGQVYSEVGPEGLASGPGGALDFARGAKLAGGLRVIVLPATVPRLQATRVVGPEAGRGPVTLSRFDVDIVITEHGAADLRGLGHDARAEQLIAIAAPEHRASLSEAWRLYRARVLMR